MTIHLPPHIESSIQAAVHSGRFASLDEAMTEAASLLVQRLNQEQAQVKPPAAATDTLPSDPLLGAWREDADLLDEIVEHALKVREERPWAWHLVNRSLLDTDILSEILKGLNPTVARNAAAYRQAFGRYSLSSVTVMEVISGLQRNQSVRRIQKFLTDISGEEVLPFLQADGKLSGEIDGDLERVGRPIGRCDPMIAAIAITNGLELVTGNTAHYQRIQQLGYPLILANWRI